MKLHRKRSLIEAVESRTLLAWSGYAQLVGQDDVASQYSSLTGAGQVIAMIDTGIDYNALGGGLGAGHKVIAGYDVVDNDSDPMDTNGHGTETAGMIVADQYTYNGVTYRGVAPDAKLVSVRVSAGGTSIADSDIEKGLQWVIANHSTYGITVVNISLGGGTYNENSSTSQLADEFQQLNDLGIFVVAASGNSGASSLGVAYPAADPNVFAVGSINSSDQISSFTQRGLELDLLAPGEQVVSTQRGGGYATIDGTSFSSPFVAGVAALLLQAAPNLNGHDVGSILRTSSVAEYDGDGDAGLTTNRFYARLNMVQAIQLAQSRNSANLDYLLLNKYAVVDSVTDATGIVHLAYYDASADKLMYATRQSDGKWTSPVKVDRNKGDYGQNLSISLDQAGRPAISYFDATNADLKYAWYNNGRWTTTTLQAKNSVGQSSSLVFDVSGDPLIAYYKKSGGDLKLLNYNRTTGKWDGTTVDTTGDVGQGVSLAFFPDSDGSTYSFAMAYADRTNGNLKYARYTNGNTTTPWVYEVVDDLNGVANISLTLDNNSATNGTAAHIAYQDLQNQDVKHAYKAGSWYNIVVASAGNVGQSVNSYIDADGNYHVVFYNNSKAATYDATVTTPVIQLNRLTGATVLVTPSTVSNTSRIGTIGLLATVSENDSGVAFLIGLNKSGKSIDDIELT